MKTAESSKYMDKKLVYLVIISAVVGILLTTFVLAAQTRLFLSPSSGSIEINQIKSVKVYVETDENVRGVTAEVTWNSSQFQFVSANTSGGAFNTCLAPSNTASKAQLDCANSAPLNGTLLVGTVNLKAISATQSAPVSLSSNSDVTDSSVSVLDIKSGASYAITSPPPPAPTTDPTPPTGSGGSGSGGGSSTPSTPTPGGSSGSGGSGSGSGTGGSSSGSGSSGGNSNSGNVAQNPDGSSNPSQPNTSNQVDEPDNQQTTNSSGTDKDKFADNDSDKSFAVLVFLIPGLLVIGLGGAGIILFKDRLGLGRFKLPRSRKETPVVKPQFSESTQYKVEGLENPPPGSVIQPEQKEDINE